MAAIAELSRGNSIRLDDDPDPIAIAGKVSQVVSNVEQEDPKDLWVQATKAELHIPLGDWDNVEAHLNKYLSNGLTPFQHEGTLRQFRDLWRLENRGPRGKAVIAMLKARGLWDNRHSTSDAWAQVVARGGELPEIPDSSLQKMLGEDGLKTYEWLIKGVTRAQSVAAVLTNSERRFGTSFVVSASELGLQEKAAGKTCMMTNFHVLNENGVGQARSIQSGCKVRFEAASDKAERNKTYRIVDIIFESALKNGLDCTVFTIDIPTTEFTAIPLEKEFLPMVSEKPKPRFYIIGYPLGGVMQFSLQDNWLLDHECGQAARPAISERRLVHYFSPTEPGNSGSPVFDDAWNCIALHHKGHKFDPLKPQTSGLPRLNGAEGRYSANQGIWIGSIAEATHTLNL